MQFVKKLRQQEEDERIKYIREKTEQKENCQQEFFIRCDRRLVTTQKLFWVTYNPH